MQRGRCSEHRQRLAEADSWGERVLEDRLDQTKRERGELCIWLDIVSTRAKGDAQNSEAGVARILTWGDCVRADENKAKIRGTPVLCPLWMWIHHKHLKNWLPFYLLTQLHHGIDTSFQTGSQSTTKSLSYSPRF